MIHVIVPRLPYAVSLILLCLGLYIVIASPNLVKKLIGLNIFQTAIFLFLIATAFVEGGRSPVIPPDGGGGPYVSPLPHVLVLTAIVVGVSLTAVGLALCIRLYGEYGTLHAEGLRSMMEAGESHGTEDSHE